jgi:hypothetical protein
MTEVFADVMTLIGSSIERREKTYPGMLLHASRDALWYAVL